MALNALRYGLPALLVIIAVALITTRTDSTAIDGFAMLVGAALSILLFNVLYRMGASGDRDREDEQAARDHFGEHGRWPDAE